VQYVRVPPGRLTGKLPPTKDPMTQTDDALCVFDLFHVVHLDPLRHAKKHCDFFVAALSGLRSAFRRIIRNMGTLANRLLGLMTANAE